MDIPIEKKATRKSKLLKIGGAALVLLLLIFMVLSLSRGADYKVKEERLTISEVTRGNFRERIAVTGVVLPISSIYLDAVEGGRVEEKFVEDGAVLKQGDPILRLSNSDLELSLINQETAVYNLLTQMQISRNAAQQNTINRLNQVTDVENAYIEAERVYLLNKRLYDQKAIGKQELIASENNFTYQKERYKLAQQVLKQDSTYAGQVARQEASSYERTRNALELMRKKVSDLVVRAPVDGQLTSLDAEIGETKTKGERLGQVDVLSGFKVRAEVDEYYISRIFPGQQGSFSLNGKDFILEIRKVYSQVTNGRFQVDMVFMEELPKSIRRGQTLQVRLNLSAEKEAVMLPKGPFYQQSGGQWVFRLSEDGDRAFRTKVELGSQNTNYYEVINGLEPGDKVITSGYENYYDKEELTLIH